MTDKKVEIEKKRSIGASVPTKSKEEIIMDRIKAVHDRYLWMRGIK